MVDIIHFHTETRSNKGDAAIFEAIKSLLSKNMHIGKYTSKRIEKLKKRSYPYFIEKTIQGPMGSKIIPQGLFFGDFYKFLKKKQKELLIKNINKHDLMIIGGGGIYSDYFLPFEDDLINSVQIPIVVFGAGYCHNFNGGMLSEEQLRSVRTLNIKAKLSSVRDNDSKLFINRLGCKTKVIGDPAVLLESEKFNIKFPKKFKVGINIANHGWVSQNEHLKNIIHAYIWFLKDLSKKQDIQIYYLMHHPKEKEVIIEIKKYFPKMKICNYPPRRLKYVYENMDFVLCMMLHSSIFCFGSSTPFVNIAYDKKNYAFMSLINKKNEVIKFDKVSPKKISAALERISRRHNKDPSLDRFLCSNINFVEKIKQLFDK